MDQEIEPNHNSGDHGQPWVTPDGVGEITPKLPHETAAPIPQVATPPVDASTRSVTPSASPDQIVDTGEKTQNIPIVSATVPVIPHPIAGKRSWPVVWWTLVLIVLILVGIVGAVYADDNGFWESGISAKLSFLPLSSLWNGLSSIPGSASSQAATAINQQPGLEYTGTMTVSQPASTTQTNTVAQSNIFFNLLAVPQTNFDFTYLGNNYSAKFNFNDAGVVTSGEYRAVGGEAYFSGNFGSTNSTVSAISWLKLGQAPNFSVASIFGDISTEIGQSSFIGEETVNGNNTYHFMAIANGNNIPIFVQSNSTGLLGSWTKSSGSLDVWLSKSSHLPVKLDLKLTNSNTGQKMEIVANMSAQIASKTITAPSGSNVISTAVTPDQQRKNDLKTISGALQKYYASNGVFPKSLSADELNNPDSVLAKALVPDYLTSLPSDPSSQHYYAYTSNGSTYSLSAVLDNANDPEGVKSGSLTLYIVNGN